MSLAGWKDGGGSRDCRAAGACSSAAGQAEKGVRLCLLFISLRLKRHSFALHECFKAYEMLFMTPAKDVSFALNNAFHPLKMYAEKLILLF